MLNNSILQAIGVIKAINEKNGHTRPSLMEALNLSDNTAHYILKKLSKSDIVTGQKGRHGGYELKNKNVTFFDVLKAFDSSAENAPEKLKEAVKNVRVLE